MVRSKVTFLLLWAVLLQQREASKRQIQIGTNSLDHNPTETNSKTTCVRYMTIE